jgi:3-methyl-2-oxobutanoate hydroxymethyltransferase
MAEARLSMPGLAQMKARGERLTMLTCYDALFARLLDASGLDLLLVGDSVNEALAGRRSTLTATLDQMIYHGASVRRGTERALIVVDLPFLSYQVSIDEAIRNAGRVMVETECHAVKLEGGAVMAPTIAALTARGIPVVGHLGLTPQSIHTLGGNRVQGRDRATADRLRADAAAVAAAGASAIVLELIPRDLATEISASLAVPTIGIGSGVGCDGQVLVLPDMLGLNPDFTPRFLRRYADLADTVVAASRAYAADVRAGRYPDDSHSFD